ncbi:MAG: zinc ABC transporter substrate-binding protein [Dehalococcoidia bacterium]|nr:zinc ABC transporter substrate-binding protein [Dehalococcoidia bacterium]
MKRKILGSMVALFLVAALLLPLSCASPSADVMAGSSLIAGIVHDVAGEKIAVRTLVPPGMCPGHYDVKPSDVEALAESKALLIHVWQQKMKNITGLIEAADNPELVIKVIAVEGNWMAPPVQVEALDKIAQALGEIDAGNERYYQQRAKERRQVILDKGEEVQARLQEARLDEVKVICSEMQQGFAGWAGFDVVATYGRPEELSVARVGELIEQARGAGVTLVIDNLQSGDTSMSQALANDIGAAQVTVSNFPGGFKGTETWEKAIDRNADLLLEALAG